MKKGIPAAISAMLGRVGTGANFGRAAGVGARSRAIGCLPRDLHRNELTPLRSSPRRSVDERCERWEPGPRVLDKFEQALSCGQSRADFPLAESKPRSQPHNTSATPLDLPLHPPETPQRPPIPKASAPASLAIWHCLGIDRCGQAASNKTPKPRAEPYVKLGLRQASG